MSTRFHFTAQGKEAEKETAGSSKIRNVGDLGKYTEVLCLGKMMTLFGDPLYITEDIENQFEYIILAKDDQGTEVYLTVYNGPSGLQSAENMMMGIAGQQQMNWWSCSKAFRLRIMNGREYGRMALVR